MCVFVYMYKNSLTHTTQQDLHFLPLTVINSIEFWSFEEVIHPFEQ